MGKIAAAPNMAANQKQMISHWLPALEHLSFCPLFIQNKRYQKSCESVLALVNPLFFKSTREKFQS